MSLSTRNAQIIAAHEAGVRQCDIAERFGISQPRVSAILTAAGVGPRRRGRPRTLPLDRAELLIYNKLRNHLGAEAAKREMGL